MLWREPLDEILGSRAKVRILRCLMRAETPLSGREIARRTDASHTGVLKAVRELLEQEVIAISSDGTGIRYRLDHDHELVRLGILPLFELEGSLESRLTQAIREVAPSALSIVLFGSTARGEDEVTSDLDVLVIVPDGLDPESIADQLIDAGLSRRFGKSVNAFVWTTGELRDRRKRNHHLLQAILRDGQLLDGESLHVLSVKGRRVAS